MLDCMLSFILNSVDSAGLILCCVRGHFEGCMDSVIFGVELGFTLGLELFKDVLD